MDTQTGLIYVTFLVVSVIVVYFTSLFAMKEKTYDEALEEQRRKQTLDAGKTSRMEKSRKEKKEKAKKSTRKGKEKEPDVLNNQKNQADKAKKDQASIEENSPQKVNHGPKPEHVDFKQPEVIILEDDSSTQLRHRKPSPVGDRPAKPILVNKGEIVKVEPAVASVVDRAPQRSNSFEVIRPKDELELMKQTKKHVGEECNVDNVDGRRNGTSRVLLNGVGVNHADPAPLEKPSSISSVKQEPDEQVKEAVLLPKKQKKQKSGHNTSQENGVAIHSKELVRNINSASLTDEEIQALIDALLNKQSDATQWTKKSDPLDNLKKQLREKEVALETERHNSEAATARLKELRHELEQEKAKQASQKAVQDREMQNLHARYQQQHMIVQEQQRKEIKALQNKSQSIIDERNVALQRMQEESSRLQQALQQLEAERASLEALSHLKHEVEQLRAERQQYERRQMAMQQSNDELHCQIQQMDDHLKSLANAKQKDEFTFQQKLGELTQQLQQMEAGKGKLVEELQQACKQCNNLESSKKMVEQQIDDREKELKTSQEEVARLKELSADLEKSLEEKTKTLEEQQLETKSSTEAASDKEAEIKKLDDDLTKCNEDLKNAKNEVETQKRINDDLVVKNGEVSEALAASEKSLDHKVAEAVAKVEKALNENLEKQVELNKDYAKQLEELKAKNTSLEELSQNYVNFLNQVTPTNGENAVANLQKIVEEYQDLKDKVLKAEDFESMKEKLSLEQAKCETLESQVVKYKRTLEDTEDMLKKLESQMVEEEAQWKTRLEEKEDEIQKLSQESADLHSRLEQVA